MKHSLVLILLVGSAYAGTYRAASCNYGDVNDCINGSGANTCNLPGGGTGTHIAVNGDIINIPAGNCSWSSTLTINVLLFLRGSDPSNSNTGACTSTNQAACGSGGGRVTVISDNITRSGCQDLPLIDFENTPQGSTFGMGVSNLTIQGSSPDTLGCTEEVKIVTFDHNMRLHDLTFTYMQTTGVFLNGDEWGVVDHSTFSGDHHRGVLIHHGQWQNDTAGGWGDNSWAQPDTMGTQKAVFVENNDFSGMTSGSGVGAVGCEFGCRAVVRYNYHLPFLGTHGTDTGERQRSIRHEEVYNNDFNDNGSLIGQAMQLRGGTVLFFNNTFTPTKGSSYTSPLALENYRDVDGWTPYGASPTSCPNGDCAGACDGTGAFDSNGSRLLSSSATSSTSSGCPFGTTKDCIVDTTQNWTANQWVGSSLRDTTSTTGSPAHHWGSVIKSNDATSIQTYPDSQGGQPHNASVFDRYVITAVNACLDQVGRGGNGATPLSGGGNAKAPSPQEWPNEPLDPVYEWNNSVNGTVQPVVSAYYQGTNNLGATVGHILPNREYYAFLPSSFNGTAGVGTGTLDPTNSSAYSGAPNCTPSVAYWNTTTSVLWQCTSPNIWTTYYTPYTYPHPLDH